MMMMNRLMLGTALMNSLPFSLFAPQLASLGGAIFTNELYEHR